MNRRYRTLLVLLLSVAAGAAAAYAVYRAVQARPVQRVEVTSVYTVVAAHALPVGSMLTSGDVKIVPWPASSPVPASFSQVEAVVGRGLVAAVEANEPLTEGKVAPPGAGAGLPPTIPTGMRAISVRVNEVIGVAGFVIPGTRVDVMVILSQAEDTMARVVVSNVQVLTAGTKFDQESAQEGQAMPSSVVTLLATPEDAQTIGLAASEGQILLTLRNPLDMEPTAVDATRTASLVGEPEPEPAAPRQAIVRAPPPPPPPPAPPVYSVETIRAAKRSEEKLQ